MLPTTREWVNKAEGDYDVVLLLRRSRNRRRFDPLCFHAQQCVEKYLKARLTESALAFPKTHDLSALLHIAGAIEPLWMAWLGPLKSLTDLAVLPRYPGMSATRGDASCAFETCRDFRVLARVSLGLVA
ncbi:MAG: HEPN domain-containing protein [Tepidisphaeraceae bacterium]